MNRWCLLTLFTGCQSLELSETWQLDRLRILGAQAVPAEVQPGQSVTFSSLTYIPSEQTIDTVIWFGCLPEEATSFGCTIDPNILSDFNEPPTDPVEQQEWFLALQAAGFLGAEPMIQPSWTIAEDALAMLSEEDQVEGLSAFINITAIPADSTDSEDIELAYKRLPISTNSQPNQNPYLSHFLINSVEFPNNATLSIAHNTTLDIDVVFSDGSIESYPYINNVSGVSETRTEEPYCTWYTTDGSFDQYFSLYPYTEVAWTSSDISQSNQIIVVARDRRGGMDWMTLNVEVQ